jgi:hypothetical protein
VNRRNKQCNAASNPRNSRRRRGVRYDLRPQNRSNAGIEATERRGRELGEGNLEVSATWQRIMAAIEKLQAEKPEPGE